MNRNSWFRNVNGDYEEIDLPYGHEEEEQTYTYDDGC